LLAHESGNDGYGEPEGGGPGGEDMDQGAPGAGDGLSLLEKVLAGLIADEADEDEAIVDDYDSSLMNETPA
jgi:hypothetical protein